ncbi:MAG: tryptophan--tRNA ligase [Chloracidobacterium sp.]|uniref:Tryptophan--tRNA ligase n=1 Tax=Chloracidobacterium validum TaxID=2821543 RepID=A0ABX8B7R2_9BACT|nr:tryptophan--tRNA ligase [Chloracidobacterium validum]QUW02997.1 tryptophan--tRNA ligase [Chloracidobacterium validum]
MTKPKRFLSGIQPSGKLHLGNYFGAIAQHIALQEEGEAFYFIANYHALTTINDATRLRELTREVAATYLALGLDPQRAVLFRQSDIPELHELAWLLATVTGMGLLERAHAYKDKVARGLAPKVGLFYYPVLMAADILAYQSDVVPVGADQAQHVEMTRDMAGFFNHTYGEVFVLPEARVSEAAGLVPGTDGQKMSKSYGNVIELFADDATLKKAVMGIVTDSAPVEAPKDPERNTIFQLYALVASPEEKAAMAEAFRAGGFGYGEAKKLLLAKLKTQFGPARERYLALLARPDEIEDVLLAGAKRARAEALATIQAARTACGLA